MSARYLASLAALAIGLGGAAVTDRAPPRPAIERGPYRVLGCDLHAHTRFSDGLLGPPDLVVDAARKGLDAVAVTEHNVLFPATIAAAWQRIAGGPIVIRGEEITRGDGHVIGLGLRERVSSRDGLVAAVAAIQAQGGVAIAAHPVRKWWPSLLPLLPSPGRAVAFDGSEVVHPLAFAPRRAGLEPEGMPAFFARGRAYDETFAAVGASDAHGFAILGFARTWVFVPRERAPSEASIVDALRAGRTVTIDRSGQAHGDPEAIALLEREPIVEPARSTYASRGAFDAITRASGLLGAIGLFLVRRVARRG
jgi:hypothetical protein